MTWYLVQFIDGHTLKYKAVYVKADSRKEAISKVFDAFGSNFDHQLIDAYETARTKRWRKRTDGRIT